MDTDISNAKNKRLEHDSMGEVYVDADKLWGAQTQRSLTNFVIGDYKMPAELIRAIILVKKCCSQANFVLGQLDKTKADAICFVCEKLLSDEELIKNHFPLVVWQTGSGTQTNMNVNEVISRMCLVERNIVVHPNDDVNKGQSTNDVFPTAMHIAACLALNTKLLPSIAKLKDAFISLGNENKGILKVGRTHLQDATPIYFEDEISAYTECLSDIENQIQNTLKTLYKLTLGGTAVGTGLNAAEGFASQAFKLIANETGLPFREEANKFYGLSLKNAVVELNGVLAAFATDLIKIANDLRFLSCGPNAGINEISLPANEPGSSIMPGKVNPTQCEALIMVACEVIGNDLTVKLAHTQGQLQLNAAMPVMAFKTQESVRLLSDALDSFCDNCVKGIKVNTQKIQKNNDANLMLATALTPKIGYEAAANLVKKAYTQNKSLRETAAESGLLTEDEYETLIKNSAKKKN
jgi:fumarate hydratase class II